jgi:hypothetical protein
MNSPTGQKTSGLAVSSLVLGLLGVCCPVFAASLAAVICGHLAFGKIKKDSSLTGGGLAVAGLVLGYLMLLLWIVLWIFSATLLKPFTALGTDTIQAQKIYEAVEQMVAEGGTKGDSSLGWPADAGITTVAELKQRLVDNGFLPAEEVNSLTFEKFEFGNVGKADPGETIFIRFKEEFFGKVLCISKDGEVIDVDPGDTSHAPPRSPAYLAP